MALLALPNREYRLVSKMNRSGQYWKDKERTRRESIQSLLDQFQAINVGLRALNNSIPEFIPEPSEVQTFAYLKPVKTCSMA